MTRVGRVPVDSTSEAEGKATLTGSLVNVYPYGLWMPEEWLGIWGIAGFGTGASDLTTADGGLPDESLLSWLGAAGQRRAPLHSHRHRPGDAGRGRMLLVHEDPDVREWGASATLTWAPADHGAAPSVSVAPSWGRPASGMEALWRDPDAVLASHGGAVRPRPVVAARQRGRDRLRPGRPAEVFGRHLAGNGDAGYRFGLGGSLEY